MLMKVESLVKLKNFYVRWIVLFAYSKKSNVQKFRTSSSEEAKGLQKIWTSSSQTTSLHFSISYILIFQESIFAQT